MLLLFGSYVLSQKDLTSEGHVLRNSIGYTAQGEAISSHDINKQTVTNVRNALTIKGTNRNIYMLFLLINLSNIIK